MKITHLDIVDVHLPIFPELERTFAFIFPEGIRLIDLGILGQLAIRFYWRSNVCISHIQHIALELTYGCEPRPPCTLQLHRPCHLGTHVMKVG
jgi:hypothetical protein